MLRSDQKDRRKTRREWYPCPGSQMKEVFQGEWSTEHDGTRSLRESTYQQNVFFPLLCLGLS